MLLSAYFEQVAELLALYLLYKIYFIEVRKCVKVSLLVSLKGCPAVCSNIVMWYDFEQCRIRPPNEVCTQTQHGTERLLLIEMRNLHILICGIVI